MKMSDYLLSRGFKIWEKKDESGNVIKKRIYINNLMPLMAEMGNGNPKFFRGKGGYYDIMNDEFVWLFVGTCAKKGAAELEEYLKNCAGNN